MNLILQAIKSLFRKLNVAVECAQKTASEALTKANMLPDWNQNDETAPDYVKNRLAWTDDPKETVLIEEQTVPVGDDLNAQLECSCVLEVGKTYTVNFNEAQYECVAYSCDIDGLEEIVFIGDMRHMGLTGGNGEPFVICHVAGNTGLYVSETGDYTISISGETSKVHKIDEKYLPISGLEFSGASVIIDLAKIINFVPNDTASYETTVFVSTEKWKEFESTSLSSGCLYIYNYKVDEVGYSDGGKLTIWYNTGIVFRSNECKGYFHVVTFSYDESTQYLTINNSVEEMQFTTT